MQTFSRSTSPRSKLPTEFEESAFDQLKGLVEGIRNASIFKLSCFAEKDRKSCSFLITSISFYVTIFFLFTLMSLILSFFVLMTSTILTAI